jgi:hypothetical protein
MEVVADAARTNDPIQGRDNPGLGVLKSRTPFTKLGYQGVPVMDLYSEIK